MLLSMTFAKKHTSVRLHVRQFRTHSLHFAGSLTVTAMLSQTCPATSVADWSLLMCSKCFGVFFSWPGLSNNTQGR